MTRHKLYAILLPVAILLTACASKECYDNQNSLPLAGFYSAVGQKLQVDSLTIYGIGAPGDSVLTDTCPPMTQMYLPFRIDDRGETTFVVRPDGGEYAGYKPDTIIFRYDMSPKFVSEACGVVYIYKMQSITTTRHFIDSITCPTGEISNHPGENIRIYFRTNE